IRAVASRAYTWAWSARASMKMKSRNFLITNLLLPLLLSLGPLAAQNNLLSVAPPQKLVAKKDSVSTAKLNVQLRNGYHVNSNTPSDDYLIPLRMTWDASPLEVQETSYPSPRMEKYEFSEKPISVFTGDFELVTKFRVPSSARTGMQVI